MKTLATFIVLIFFGSQSFAVADCAQLNQELKDMQKAQQQIMISLINNHETFASSMEEYSTVAKSAPGGVRAVATQMGESAQAFRSRGVQGKKIAAKLSEATGDLLERVAACLK
jgi:hypothetical protein